MEHQKKNYYVKEPEYFEPLLARAYWLLECQAFAKVFRTAFCTWQKNLCWATTTKTLKFAD